MFTDVFEFEKGWWIYVTCRRMFLRWRRRSNGICGDEKDKRKGRECERKLKVLFLVVERIGGQDLNLYFIGTM